MKNSKQSKPKKPWPTYPLFWHRNGQWCKKIRGNHHYFGTDSRTAHDEYIRVAEDLHAGRTPRRRRDDGVPSVKDLVNGFLNTQRQKEANGSNGGNWYDECVRVSMHFAEHIGKDRPWDDLDPSDFGKYRNLLCRLHEPPTISRHVGIVRSVFKHAFVNNFITEEVRFGDRFKKPSEREMRRHQNTVEAENGVRLFGEDEVRALLDESSGQLRAMILLGVNGGYYAVDCAGLPIQMLDDEYTVSLFPRNKTGMKRTVPLWPETSEAISEVLNGKRPTPRSPDSENLVFLTQRGNPWRTEKVVVDAATGALVMNPKTGRPKVQRKDAVSLQFSKLLDKLDIRRAGRGFGTLRHTFRTWADETLDQHAVDHIMGHKLPGMRGRYVKRFEMTRLRAITDHVRAKVFG